MKALLLSLLLSLPAQAGGSLTAMPFAEVMQRALSESYTFLEKGMLFGYFSTESCIYTSPGVVLVEHYCYPKKQYPARAITLWSREFGMVHLYEEDYGERMKRDIEISEFPEFLGGYLPQNLEDFPVSTMNEILEKLYRRTELPACWSTSFSPYSRSAEADCYQTEIGQFPGWARETQGVVNEEGAFNGAFRLLLEKIRPAGLPH